MALQDQRSAVGVDHGVSLAAVDLLASVVAAREIGARLEARLPGLGNYLIAAAAVTVSTGLTVTLALTTAIRPDPWWEPRYAIPLAGIILGSVLNAGNLGLDAVLRGAAADRAGIEAQLALGVPYGRAMRPLLRELVRLGLLPITNQMIAAG